MRKPLSALSAPSHMVRASAPKLSSTVADSVHASELNLGKRARFPERADGGDTGSISGGDGLPERTQEQSRWNVREALLKKMFSFGRQEDLFSETYTGS